MSRYFGIPLRNGLPLGLGAVATLRSGGAALINSATNWYFAALGLTGTPWADVSRTGLGTRVGPDGLVGFGPHNLQRNSENIGGAGWAVNEVSLSSGPTPPSPYSASKTVTGSGVNTVHWILGEGATGPKRARYVVKAGTHQFVQILWSGASGIYANFDLVSGVLGTYTTSAQNIAAIGDGWFEIYSETTSAAAGTPFLLLVSSTTAGWYANSTASGTVHVTGAQSAAIPSPLDYIPTTTAARYLPRITHDPVTLSSLGLLVEGQATNEIGQHSLASPQMVTQTITVTAAQRTLSFYGTGTVTLTGAHSATVVGTGAYPSRRTLTFTPSAGSLTLTVSGTVQFPQQETGPVATSYIPNPATTSALRVADDWFLSGANLASALPAGVGINTIVLNIEKTVSGAGTSQSVIAVTTLGYSPGNLLCYDGSGTWSIDNAVIGGGFGPVLAGVTNKIAISWNATTGRFSASANGGAAVETTGATLNAFTRLALGHAGNGTLPARDLRVSVARVLPGQYITGAALQALTA